MIFFNDRRSKPGYGLSRTQRKTQKATTRAQIGAMAKSGTLRAEPKATPGALAFNKSERSAVKREAQNVSYQYRNDGRPRELFSKPNKSDYAEAIKRVEKDPEKTGYSAESADYYKNNQGGKRKKGKF